MAALSLVLEHPDRGSGIRGEARPPKPPHLKIRPGGVCEELSALTFSRGVRYVSDCHGPFRKPVIH